METSTFGAIEKEQHQALAHQQILLNNAYETIDRRQNNDDPLQMAVGKVDNETYNLKQSIAQDDQSKFVVATQSEINGHIDGKHWKVVMCSDFRFPPAIKSI